MEEQEKAMSEKSQKQAEKEQSGETVSQFIYQGKIISLRHDTTKVDQGQIITSDIVSHPGAVALIPIDAEGKILLIKQWRRAAKQIIIEIPAGTLEPSETPLVCAQRELQEEIGYKAETIIPLGGIFTCPSFCTEYIHLFLAKDLVESPLYADDTDCIDLMPVTLEEAWSLVDNNTINDAKTIAAIGLYQRWLNRQKGTSSC